MPACASLSIWANGLGTLSLPWSHQCRYSRSWLAVPGPLLGLLKEQGPCCCSKVVQRQGSWLLSGSRSGAQGPSSLASCPPTPAGSAISGPHSASADPPPPRPGEGAEQEGGGGGRCCQGRSRAGCSDWLWGGGHSVYINGNHILCAF